MKLEYITQQTFIDPLNLNRLVKRDRKNYLLFVESIMKTTGRNFIAELECTVCLEIPKIDTRVLQCNNGHIFCQVCYVKLDLCPTCRKKLVCVSDIEKQHSPIRCLIAESLIRQFFNAQTNHQIVAEIGRNAEVDYEDPECSVNKEFNGKKEIEPSSNKQTNKIFCTNVQCTNVQCTNKKFNKQKDFGVYWGRRLPTML